MALRVEEFSGPRNIGLLQTLNKSFDWKSINNIPLDPMVKLTRVEAQTLKDKRGDIYIGPYRLEEDDIHLAPPSNKEAYKLTLINVSNSLEKSDIVRPTLIEVSKLPQSDIIFSAFKEPVDNGEYYSNGDKF